MTIEEAIKILKDAKITYIAPNGKQLSNEALDMAVQALRQTDGDLISREDVLNIIDAEKWEYIDYVTEDIGGNVDTHIRCYTENIRDRLSDLSTYSTEQTDGDLINRQAVITMLNKIENAVEDGDGFQFNEWIEYAKDIPSAKKTAEWISVLEQIKEELSHISKPKIDREDYENGVYDGVNLAIRTIDKYAGELVHTDISLIKKDILSELEKLENYPSKDNSVFARINTYKRCIGIIDKHIGELEQTA